MLATYHPAYVLRNYTSRIAVIGDLIKVKRESETREIVFPHRELWLSPTLADIAEFKRAHLDGAELISVDIETAKGQITEIGFAPSRHLALVVPFTDYNLSRNYWATAAEEARAWGLVRDICGSPVPKLLQNGLYDQYWLWMKAKIKIRNYLHDTRLLHHALYPELPKDLASMVATYESAPAWKHMRARKTEKRDE